MVDCPEGEGGMMSGRHEVRGMDWGMSTGFRWGLVLTTLAFFIPQPLPAQQPAETRCTRLLYYTRADSELGADAEKYLKELVERRKGVRLERRDVSDAAMAKELKGIAKRLDVKPGLPAFYVYDQLLVGWEDAKKTGPDIEDMLRMQVFVRDGCPHCAHCKEFLSQIAPRYPGLKIEYHKVVEDAAARGRMEALYAQHKITAPGLPTISFCGQLLVGFLEPETTGKKILDYLDRATLPCPAAKPAAKSNGKSALLRRAAAESREVIVESRGTRESLMRMALRPVELTPMLFAFATSDGPAAPPSRPAVEALPDEEPDADLPAPPAPPGEDSALPPPPAPPGEDSALPPPPGAAAEMEDAGDEADLGDDLQETKQVHKSAGTSEAPSDVIAFPLIGEIRAGEVGLPLFTMAIGLLDGFNPCAMWVLLFLLSLLVNIGDRMKMLMIAGTFVVVSGIAYFIFMAAWLNVFLLLGYMRWVEIPLALVAIFIGIVNVKDFFAFKKGLSLSIPESAKPKIYERVRKIVMAKYMSMALLGAVVLAVTVNVVEFLCTAGFPALYTRVLTVRELPTWEYYAYLGLYIFFYMFDDAVMVAIAIATLSRRRLQESSGRWLKLASGAVVLAIGLVMLFKPNWLNGEVAKEKTPVAKIERPAEQPGT